MSVSFWGSVIVSSAVVGGVLIWALVPHRQRLRHFDGRPDLSLDQIYNEHFAEKGLSKELVCELWKEVSLPLHVAPGKLRPTDRFDRELAAPKGWEFDDDIVEIQWAAERRLKQTGVQADLSQIKTVADYVEFFCSLSAHKRRT